MNKEYLEVARLTLDTIMEIQETQIFILKKLNKFEKQITSLKVQNTSISKMCNEMKKQVDATIVRKSNKKGETQ